MPALAEARRRRETLLTIRGKATSWSVPGRAVASIERLSEWSGEPPLDVAAVLGSAEDVGSEARVVVIHAERTRLPLLASGTLSLLETDPEQLLPLPPAFGEAAPLVDQVALVDGRPAVFVLSPQRLLEAWRSAARPPAAETPPSSSR